jgi:ATP-dependent Lon protease
MSTAQVATNPLTNLPPSEFAEINQLRELAASKPMPAGLQQKINAMLLRLERMLKSGGYSKEYESYEQYVRWSVSIPWGVYIPDNLDLPHANEELNKHHYGLQHVKDMVLEYLAVMKLQQQRGQEQQADVQDMSKLRGSSANAPVLCFIGIQGVGKTSIAKSIAASLGRPFVRIALGAMGEVSQLRGVSITQPNAEPGYILKALVNSKAMNPVILLDEIDKTSSESGLRADLMAALLEILDPEQNSTFTDHYLDYPVDLSRCMFITTANNLGGITAAVQDRLEIIRFGSYTDDDKVHIAKNYMLPKVREATGITEQQLSFDDEVWPLVVRPLGFDAGVRQLERTLAILARKVARLIVEGKGTSFHLTKDNFRQFIPDDMGVYS